MSVIIDMGIKTNIQHEVKIDVKPRKVSPSEAVIYVGPTNSGKTFNALQALYEEYEANNAGRYVYAGPLRMLAYEVYEKMVDRYGEENVGFITGEEQINPDAPLLACTVEMAPMEGSSLVLDETHWIVDPDRGQHWTNLLVSGQYDRFHILTAMEALNVIAALVDDARNLDLKEFTRKTSLKFKGNINIYSIPNRTAVVCFSRKAVYAVAHMLEESGKKVGVLYGSLPLKAREAQINKYLAGEYEVMVTTDVIGHGINLPIDNVVFVQSEKFDGTKNRSLYTWEIAQISGRAGRFKLSDEGSVYVLTGKDWFTTDYDLLSLGVAAGAGLCNTDLDVTKALITPAFKDLNITTQTEILSALNAWQTEASKVFTEMKQPLQPSNLNDMKQLLYTVSDHLNAPLHPDERGDWGVNVQELWSLISGPFNPEGKTIKVIAEWLQDPDRKNSRKLNTYFDSVVDVLYQPVMDADNIMGDQIAVLETAAQVIGELKMANIMFQGTGTLRYSELIEYEDRISDAIINTLHHMITKGVYGECVNCHSSCSPWFKYCEECYWGKR